MTVPVRAASRTAVLVCQGRAAAHGRVLPDRFHDEIAIALLRPEERAVVDLVRAETPPVGWSERTSYESVRAVSEIMVPRTVAIDEALARRPAPQVVVLGAGLDARAWRLKTLADAEVWEVDHPASQADKRDRLGDRTPLARSVRFVPVDFSRDDLGDSLAAAGHEAAVPTVWVWEGVIPYLTRPEVDHALQVIASRSASDSTLVLNYQTPSVRATLGRRLAQVMTAVGGQRAATSGEPWRSLWRPGEMGRLLAGAGFRVVSDDDLLTISEGICYSPHGRTSARNGRVALAVREARG